MLYQYQCVIYRMDDENLLPTHQLSGGTTESKTVAIFILQATILVVLQILLLTAFCWTFVWSFVHDALVTLHLMWILHICLGVIQLTRWYYIASLVGYRLSGLLLFSIYYGKYVLAKWQVHVFLISRGENIVDHFWADWTWSAIDREKLSSVSEGDRLFCIICGVLPFLLPDF